MKPERKPVVEVRDLNAWYDESHALHGVDFKVHEGETVALLGRNGAGRSTTLKALLGMIPHRKGSVRIHGQETIHSAPRQIARLGMGYVPENRGIFASLSTWENLVMPPVLFKGGPSAEQLMKDFPNLGERRNSPAGRLSGGEQQMLSIARVLRTGVKVILMDEPTEGLAPVIVKQIQQTLLNMKQRGYALILVEQNYRFISTLADHYYVIQQGKTVASLDAEQVRSEPGLAQKYLGL